MTKVRRLDRMQDPAEVSAALGIPFSDEQLHAIAAPLEPGVVVAGAGSGKTTVMAARVVWLVGSEQVRPEQVLGLTFTRKAAGELAARIGSALQAAGLELAADEATETVMTYDAFAGAVLAEHGARVGVASSRRLLGPAAAFRLASQVVRDFPGDLPLLCKRSPVGVTEAMQELDAALAAHLVSEERLLAHGADLVAAVQVSPPGRGGAIYQDLARSAEAAQERAELARLIAEFRRRKAELDVAGFADQMAEVADLVATMPQVGHDLRQRYRVVLLDEYQDTSAAQVQVLRGLFSGPDPARGRGFPVTAVGDPLQAIYGWRGASSSNITTFARDFPRPDGSPAATFSLAVNRRSRPQILAVANALSSDLRAAGPGNILVAPEAGGNEQSRPGHIVVGQFETRASEVARICDRIIELRSAPVSVGGVDAWSDIAVLTRTNAGAGEVYAHLIERDVPAEIVGLGGLLDIPEVADVVATLRVIDDVTANAALLRLLTGPRWRLGDTDVEALGRRARELTPGGAQVAADPLQRAVAFVDRADIPSLAAAVADPGLGVSAAARDRCTALAAELANLRAHRADQVVDLVRRVIATVGIDVELGAAPDLIERGGKRQLSAFVDAVVEFADADPDATVTALLAYLDAARERENGLELAPPSPTDSVKLLTVHRAKGLEWDVVFVPFLISGSFPGDRLTDNWLRTAAALPAPLRGDADSLPVLQRVDKPAFDEYAAALRADLRASEDRLAYVAASRARRMLVMTAAWWQPGSKRPKSRSDYLDVAWPFADEVVEDWPAPQPDDPNPCAADGAAVAWAPTDPARLAAKQALARRVDQLRRTPRGERSDPQATLDDEARFASWDHEMSRLLAEAKQARSGIIDVRLPASLTTYQVMSAHRDPEAFALSVARPMPKPPAPAAETGVRFHEWVQRRFSADTLPGMEMLPADLDPSFDAGPAGEEDFAELCERFAAGQFGQRSPYAVEQSFSIALGQPVRGRIDAVYAENGGWLVVDWKTSRSQQADPLQLAVYRVAWAEYLHVPLESVRAAFYYVRSDELVELAVQQRLDRRELEEILTALTDHSARG